MLFLIVNLNVPAEICPASTNEPGLLVIIILRGRFITPRIIGRSKLRTYLKISQTIRYGNTRYGTTVGLKIFVFGKRRA